MSLTYQPLWEEPRYYDHNAISQDCPSLRFDLQPSNIDPYLVGKDQFCEQPFHGMTSYLNQPERTYCQISDQEYMMGGTSPLPVMRHDHPCDPSSPEGSESSDGMSSMMEDLFIPTPSPHTYTLSRTNSIFSNGQEGLSRVNSRSSTFMDSHMWAPAFYGGVSYPQTTTSNLADIQGSPDPDMLKTEDESDGNIDIKMDSTLRDLFPMTQHSTLAAHYHNYNDNITCHDSPALTSTTNIKSEGDAENEDSDVEFAEAAENESDADYRPSGGRRPSTRRTMPRRKTVSDAPKPSRITKSKAPPLRTSMNGSVITAQRSGEHKYPCVFSFVGCTSMWKTKNEWKRHAMTQHLVLESYHCKLCKKDNGENVNGLSNGNGKGKMGKNIAWANVGGVDGQVFNRKDLFTQHVKRMHEPTAYRQCSKGGGTAVQKKEYEEWIKRQQEVAHFHTGRQALNVSVCPMPGCLSTFQGRKGWDDRLEHIWKHFERKECDAMTDMGEGGLKEWAVASGVVVHDTDGRLVPKECTTEEKTCSEEDADGEVE